MRKLSLIPVLAVLVLGAACASTDEVPVVATEPPSGHSGPVRRTEPGEIPAQEVLDPNRVVARVNDEIITVRAIQAKVGEAIAAFGDASEADLVRILDEAAFRMIVEELQVEAGTKLGLTVTRADLDRAVAAEEAKAKERGVTFEQDLIDRGIALWEWEEIKRREILARRYIALQTGEITAPTPELRARTDMYVRPLEVRAYYDRHPELFKQEEQAKVDGLFIRRADFTEGTASFDDADERARSYAEALVARARKGDAFSELVAEVHQQPLDVFRRPFGRGEAQLPEVEEFAWSAKEGQVSDPIPRSSGYLVLCLEQRREARVLPFEEARVQISIRIQNLKYQAAQVEIQSELLRDSVVTPKHFERRLKRVFAQNSAQIRAELAK